MKAFIEKLKNKIPSELVKPALSCVAIFCLLTVSVVVLLGNMSLGWFGSNDSVSANDMQTSIKGTKIEIKYYFKTEAMDDYAEMTSPDQMIDGLIPGASVTIRVVYTNNDDRSFTLSPYLDYEDGYETPIIDDDGKYYYLSSQLMVNDNLMMSGAKDGLYFTEEQTPNDISLGEVSLAIGETKTLEFTIEFVNLDVNQNAYVNFSASGGSCFRVIHSDYTVVK